MTETMLAAAGAAMIAGSGASDDLFSHNPVPGFALVTSFPEKRFEQDTSGIYLMPRQELLSIGEGRATLRHVTAAEFMDILPDAEALSYEMAVIHGRQATSLIGDDSPDVDLGSAL